MQLCLGALDCHPPGGWKSSSPKAAILTDRFPLILVEDLAVAPIHVGHVDGVAICPIDFPVGRCEVHG